MRRVFYITRSYMPSVTGGTIIRAGTVEHLNKLGYQVIVVTPSYDKLANTNEERIFRIPIGAGRRYTMPLERVGILEDYLDFWIGRAFKMLSLVVMKEDLILATSGGELGCIKLAVMLKESFGCKAVVNFHDPLDYSMVNGRRINGLFHVSREKTEEKYLKEVDLIVTSSESYMNSLTSKYPEYASKIANNYFGYVKSAPPSSRLTQGSIKIGYGGAMGFAQRPQLLLKAVDDIKNIEICFIGDVPRLKKMIRGIKKHTIIGQMGHEQYLKYAQENFDVGFVSLAGEYYGACVPSKIYELINLGIPILGALPEGDAMSIINGNEFGIACHYSDFDGLREAVLKLSDFNYREKIRKNILTRRHEWSMEKRVLELKDYMEMMT